MTSKVLWIDTLYANADQAGVVNMAITEYYATRILPISLLNEREGTLARDYEQPRRIPLDVQMLDNPLFRQVVEQGLNDLEQGHYRQLEAVKRKLGDV